MTGEYEEGFIPRFAVLGLGDVDVDVRPRWCRFPPVRVRLCITVDCRCQR